MQALYIWLLVLSYPAVQVLIKEERKREALRCFTVCAYMYIVSPFIQMNA